MLKYKHFTALLLIMLLNIAYSQLRKPYIENFTPKDYGTTNHVGNWAVVQGNNGIMYFGNNTKVLLYDGQKWDNVEVTKNGFILSLAKAENNRIYVGSKNEFGYIDIDEKGIRTYSSLSDKLREQDKYFGEIRRIFYSNNTTYFFSQKQIYIYKNDEITILKPIGTEYSTFHLAFMVNDKLFVRQRGLGLLQYNNNNKLELIEGGEAFEEYGVFGVISFEKKYLIITQEIGLFEYVKEDNKITYLETEDTKDLISYQIFGAIKLHDNKVALNTEKNGVVIIDSLGAVHQVFNEKTGIIDNGVNSVYQDFYNDLWLATKNGICRINYSSPVSFYNEETGIYGNVLTTIRFNKRLYVGTTNGLFVQLEETENRFFKRIKGIDFSVKNLIVAHNMLIISSEKGVYSLQNNETINKISDVDARVVVWVKEKQLLCTAGLYGLSIYKYNNSWRLQLRNEEIIDKFFTMNYEMFNDNIVRLWISSSISGVHKVDIDENLNIDTYAFIAEAGIGDSWVRVFKYNSEVYFSQTSGVYKYMTINEINETVDDSLKKYNSKGLFAPYNNLKIKAGKSVFDIKQQNSELFANVENTIMYANGEDSLTYRKFNLIDYQVYNYMYLEEGKTLWLCSNNGLFAYDLENKYNTDAKPRLYNRQVKCSVDSVLYNGNKNSNNDGIEYNFNTLVFDFSSLYIQNGIASTYSHKLEGYDEDWSKWTTRTDAKFPKLHEGEYTFMVKAKTIYGVESDVIIYKFEILRPWYRSIIAYIMYGVFIIILIVLVIRLYTARLKAQNIQLEKIVKERTAEVVKQKDEITKIHKEVQDSINYAERIQLAVLPSREFISNSLDESFILFKPKDIVSGDYYWAYKHDNCLIVTVADCTGHGVPGAFMSMLGISFLNEIVTDNHNATASQIIDELRDKIIFALKQKGVEGEQKDGMDMSLCIINLNTNVVQWAGANNPLYILSENKVEIDKDIKYKIFEDDKLEVTNKILYEIKSDNMPVAHYVKMDKFKNHVFKLNKGDKIYMFSDGYADQFGGPKGKKYKYKPFKRLLVNTSDKTMDEQNKILDDSVEQWRMYEDKITNKEHEQIDDICLIGIKL